jgi:transcriptional regulator GlxA family with amidase domain
VRTHREATSSHRSAKRCLEILDELFGRHRRAPNQILDQPGVAFLSAMDKRRLWRHSLTMMPKTPRSPPNGRRIVEVLAYPSVKLLDVTGPIQVFASANAFMAQAGEATPYSIRIVAQSGERVEASGGVELAVHPLSPIDALFDTLVIAGGEGVSTAAEDTVLIDWVRERAKQARRTASVCTGAFLLAASGMLDDRRAVMHWAFCGELARRFPRVRVEPDPIFVQDGAIWTSAGVTVGIDLALALVEEDLGRSVALAIARYLVVFLKRPGGQAQFSEFLSLQAAEDKFGVLHDWISNHLADDLSLPVLAREAGMSERSLSRHYAEATGLTPARAIERLRVQGARHLLAETRLPVKRISQRCGFGSEETMRRSFLRLLNTTRRTIEPDSPDDFGSALPGCLLPAMLKRDTLELLDNILVCHEPSLSLICLQDAADSNLQRKLILHRLRSGDRAR